MTRTYTDVNGTWEEETLSNGAKVARLVTPSQAFNNFRSAVVNPVEKKYVMQ